MSSGFGSHLERETIGVIKIYPLYPYAHYSYLFVISCNSVHSSGSGSADKGCKCEPKTLEDASFTSLLLPSPGHQYHDTLSPRSRDLWEREIRLTVVCSLQVVARASESQQLWCKRGQVAPIFRGRRKSFPASPIAVKHLRESVAPPLCDLPSAGSLRNECILLAPSRRTPPLLLSFD